MKRREFIRKSMEYLAGSFFLPGITRSILISADSIVPTANPNSEKPNIVLILVDDLGFADLGIQGCKDISTPNMDSIGKNGVRFSNGYVSCPLCSPTRAGLMTGRYQERFGHEFNPGGESNNPNFGLPLTEKTIAERLKPLGYVTGIVGKWHLGNTFEKRPLQRGFDEFYGFLGGAHPYLPQPNRKKTGIYRGNEEVESYNFLTEDFGREAVSFIERHKEKPFFLYLPFNAVHAPMQVPEKYIDRFKKIKDKKRRTFAGMLSALDDAVGEILKKIRETKLEEKTLIFLISDNGGPTRSTSSRNNPLRGFKGQMYEGGIRIPYMMQWKGHLPADEVYHKPVISLDACPTILAAAGSPIPPDAKLDGVNLLPYLTGKNAGSPHEELFWRMGKQGAVRKGDWKLVVTNNKESQLYYLAKDIGETKDLAKQNPDKLKELKADYEKWNSQLMKPLWHPTKAEKKQKRLKKQT